MMYGLYRINNARLDVFPEFSPTQVVIQTEAPGLSAELVETLVSQPLENGVAGVPDIQFGDHRTVFIFVQLAHGVYFEYGDSAVVD